MVVADEGIAACGTMSEARAPYCLPVAEPILGPKWWLGGGVGLPPSCTVHLLLLPFSESCSFCNMGKMYKEWCEFWAGNQKHEPCAVPANLGCLVVGGLCTAVKLFCR